MDRTVLITGANSGIGLATAIELGRRGFRSVGSVRSAAKAKAVAAAGVAVVLVEPGTFKTGIWDEAERDMARRTGSRYAGAYRRSLASMRFTQPLMGDPARVAAVIGRALTAWYPRARYLVGTDAQLIALTDMVLPTAVRDRLTRLVLGL